MQFWLKRLTFLSPAMVQGALNAGRMTVNGDHTTSGHCLAPNDVVEYAFHLHEPPVCTFNHGVLELLVLLRSRSWTCPLNCFM